MERLRLLDRVKLWLERSRTLNWIKVGRGQLDVCDWCEATGVIPEGVAPAYKADASCVECRGTGFVPRTVSEEK